jgi:pimeloyl-ACP methyl ester carboxylesterase
MRSILRAAKAGATATTQMIWLPGAYHSAHDFLRAGFARAVLDRQLPLDLTFVDLEMQHLADRAALQPLRSDIVLPALASGTAVWLAGISLGGSLALDYASSYPDGLAGLCLLAPYLGNRMLITEIAASGGLAAWDPGELAETDAERRIWRYVKTRAPSPSLFLGYGRDDRFSPAHSLLAKALPADAIDVIDGGHEWRTWSKLWENFLDSHFK